MGYHEPAIGRQILSEPLKHIWRVALNRNNFNVVGQMIDEYAISPSTEVSPYGCEPISYIVNRGHPRDPAASMTVQVLISKGAELIIRDRQNAVPADHALCSDSPDLAHMLVLETVRSDLLARRQTLYSPNVEGIIRTTMSHAERASKVDNLHRNLGQVLERLWDGCRDRDPIYARASNTAMAQLEVVNLGNPIEMFTRSRPSGQLKDAHERYKYIQQSPDCEETLVDLAKARGVVQHEQWLVAHDL